MMFVQTYFSSIATTILLLSSAEMERIFKANDIDYSNAIQFYNENRNKPLQQENDVYDLLKSFIKNKPHLDVFVDEW